MAYAQMDAMLEGDITRFKDAPVFTPFLWGERCPGWDDARAGGFTGLKGHHGADSLYFAVLEGILFNLRQCYAILVDIGGAPKEIRVSGGIVNSGVLKRMAADIMGRRLHISPQSNASTVGGAAVALHMMGILPTISQFPAARGMPVEPDARMCAFYEGRYTRYMEAYTHPGRVSG